jgi:lysozyme
MTPEGLALLRADEGLRLLAYDDATGQTIVPGYQMVGHPTVGVGRDLDINGISNAEAETLLADDVTGIEAALTAAIPCFATLDPARADVLTNVAFNCGIAGLLSFHRMLAAVAVGDWAQAAAELLDSGVARQLPARYQRLANVLLNGYPQTPGA